MLANKGSHMNESQQTIKKIKELLDGLEKDLLSEDEQLFLKNFDALELPSLIQSVVDYLQPVLLPYEAAIYWFMFRHSILATGQQYVRVSVRGMTSGVVMPTARGGKSETLSYNSVKTALQGLEEKQVILKAGDTNREGTLYKVNLPEEVPACEDLMKEKSEKEVAEVDTKKELDYYNVQENRLKIFERDGYKCHYCQKQLTRFSATLDHIQPVSKGGDNSYDNLITACLHCNSERGNKPVMDIIQQKNG